MEKPLIWIFGNGVQDITVEVDIDSLIRDNGALIQSVALKNAVLVKKGSLFMTRLNDRGFGVEIDLEKAPLASNEPEVYALDQGEKYTLRGRVESLNDQQGWLARSDAMVVHCEDITWGGGGVNVCRYLRALAPHPDRPRLRYTDYAMSNTFARMIKALEAQIMHTLPANDRRSVTLEDVGEQVEALMRDHVYEGERLICRISDIFAKYSPERSLEVFLASILVDPLLFRPKSPVFARNWVFSKFQTAERSTQDKIICRSKPTTEDDLGVTNDALDDFLAVANKDSVGAIVLNSIRHERFFQSAYQVYRTIQHDRRQSKPDDFIGILAMTKAMQPFVTWMRSIGSVSDPDHLPPFILIFNEAEAVEFASRLNITVPPILRAEGDLPNVMHFARIVEAIRPCFGFPCPRIYVTTGPRGSLGFDGTSNTVIHVSYYSRLGDILFDTNSCGDAYCAAITLMEWAKRCCGDIVESQESPAEEMRYFMAVATAAAYCKARDRRGRIDAKTIRALLDDTYLGSGLVGFVDDILAGRWPSWVDADGRAHRPPDADFRTVRKTLAFLMQTKFDVNTVFSGEHDFRQP